MANAKLHMICGNCGCNDDFEFKLTKEDYSIDNKEIFKDEVYIICNNCGTLHTLSDNAKLREDKE